MNKSLLVVYVLLFLLSSCGKDAESHVNSKGEIEFLPYLWKAPIHLDGHNGSRYNTSFSYNMTFGNNVLISTTNSKDSRNITMLNSDDGNVLWNWSEFFQPETESVSASSVITDGNYYRWVTGTRHYAIDLNNGQSVLRWRDEPNSSMGSENTYVPHLDLVLFHRTTENSDGTISNKLFSTSLLNQDYELFLEIPYDVNQVGENNRVKGINSALYYSKDEVDYLVIQNAQSYPNWYYDSRVNLYDLTNREWVYRDLIAADAKQNNGGTAKVYGDNYFFTAGKEMFCYNILSGEQLWRNEFEHDFTFSGFEISENTMIANCENQVCYGIDISDGSVKWASEGSGTSSLLQTRIMNGVAYFSGGGPAFLFAKDIHTGKTLWRLDPYLYESVFPSWHNTLNLVPGKNGMKGKIIVTNSNHAYCFEAAK